MIETINLNKNFGQKAVLKNINLRFEKGHAYGIVGENGAGKTTLFRCIAGLENFDGRINSDQQPLKNHLGLLLTEPFFLTKMTGREYVQMLCNARGIKLEKMDERNIFELPLDQYASTYSTGMKKKLAITALLFQGNDYFILDEPFNGVDIHSNLIITEIIVTLKRLGKIVLISSHIFSTLKDTCDKIFLLHAGEILKTVEHAQFDALESEMKITSIGDKIAKLDLR